MTRIRIQGGRVLDPATGRDELLDLDIEDGRIAAVGPGVSAASRIASSKLPARASSSTASRRPRALLRASQRVQALAIITPSAMSELRTRGYIIHPPSANSVMSSYCAKRFSLQG